MLTHSKSVRFTQSLSFLRPEAFSCTVSPGVGKSLMASAVIEENGRKAFVCRKDQPNGDFVFEKIAAALSKKKLLSAVDIQKIKSAQFVSIL